MTRAGFSITRRGALAGALGLALAGPGRAATPASEILAGSGLGAWTGFVLAEAGTGAVIEAHQGGLALPPASVGKILTALYALDRLGPGRRFETRLRAGEGALALVGGGDPLLDTDGLADLLAEAGPIAAPGRLVVDASALPALAEIDSDQPAQAGYNPGIAGLNLNFNRVFLAWGPGAKGPDLRLSAPGTRFEADAPGIRAEIAGAGPPRHRQDGAREIWTFSAASLAGKGSLWLPVRAPASYAGEAFRTLAAQRGLALPAPEFGPAPEGITLARRAGDPLEPMARDMLKYSTNLTAETIGLAASGAPDLAASGAAMTDWARGRYGLGAGTRFINHSGLTGASQVTAAELVGLLVAAQGQRLPDLLRERPLKGPDGKAAPVEGVRILAKTGTLNFVSALAGYVEGPGDRRLAFAILAADAAARARMTPGVEDPPGAGAFARRARAQEQALLRRWIAG